MLSLLLCHIQYQLKPYLLTQLVHFGIQVYMYPFMLYFSHWQCKVKHVMTCAVPNKIILMIFALHPQYYNIFHSLCVGLCNLISREIFKSQYHVGTCIVIYQASEIFTLTCYLELYCMHR